MKVGTVVAPKVVGASAPIEFSEGRVVGVDDRSQESVIHTPRAPAMERSSMSCLSLPVACTYLSVVQDCHQRLSSASDLFLIFL